MNESILTKQVESKSTKKVTVTFMIDAVFNKIFNGNIHNTVEILSNYFGIDLEISQKEDYFILEGIQIDEFEFDDFIKKWFYELPMPVIISYYGSEIADCGLRLTENGLYEKFKTEQKI